MGAVIPSSSTLSLLLLLLLGSGAVEISMNPDQKINQDELHGHRNILNHGDDNREMEDHKVFEESPVIQMVVDNGKNDIHLHPHDHTDHSLMVFFTMKDLKVGKTLPIHFPKRDPSASPPLLQREKAESIPFSSNQLPQILRLFKISQKSPQATAMEDTLRQCERKPINGETKTCATSFESMLEFMRGTFRGERKFRALSTTHITKSATHFQNYTFLESPRKIEAVTMAACHTMPYPYAVFYCHYQKSETKVFEISLVGENGDRVEAIAVCHVDTSQWGPNHPSFRVLKVERGTIPICHFFPSDHLVWVPIM